MWVLMGLLFILGILEVFYDLSVKIIKLFVKDKDAVKNDYGFGVGAFFIAISIIYFAFKVMPIIIDFLLRGYTP